MTVFPLYVARAVFSLLAITMTLAIPTGNLWADDTLVIELGDIGVTRDALNERFRIAAGLLAHRQGVVLADQEPTVIESLRRQYLDKYATELVLLRDAERRDVRVPESVVDAALAELFNDAAAAQAKFLANASAPADSGSDYLRQVIRDEKTIELLTEHLLQEINIAPGDVVTLHHDIKDTLATPEQVCVRHIQTDSHAKAAAVRARLESGANFEALAKSLSGDASTAAMGGNLGCFARGAAGTRSAFENVAFQAGENELAGPVESELGFHVVFIYEHKMPRAPTLNEAYTGIERELALQQLPHRIETIVSDSGVRTYPDNFAARANSE